MVQPLRSDWRAISQPRALPSSAGWREALTLRRTGLHWHPGATLRRYSDAAWMLSILPKIVSWLNRLLNHDLLSRNFLWALRHTRRTFLCGTGSSAG